VSVSTTGFVVASPLPTTGFIGALRGFAAGFLGSVHDRLELLSVELHEEKHRLVQTFIWISGVIVSGMLAIIFASLTLVVAFWETSARLGVVGGLAALYALAAIGLAIGFRRFLARQPRPFAASLNELQEDRTCIPPEN
jgi:uncharacterized membrane protein YqjE